MRDIYVLGGYQTDFAVNWAKQDQGVFDILAASVNGALDATDIEPADIDVAHVGNFAGELFTGQGHLGGLFGSLNAAFDGVPSVRHEAACASGSMAVLGAAAEIEAGRYDVAAVVGIEQMRNVSTPDAAEYLGSALWVGVEAVGEAFPWPSQFSDIADEYDRRYGLEYEHLMTIAEKAFDNAKRNPHAQSRSWQFEDDAFTADDDLNPPVAGRIRKQDCARITDGAATVILASAEAARAYASRRGMSLDEIPRISGWGHRTTAMKLDEKLVGSRDERYVFPHIRGTITDAWRRAEIAGPEDLDAIETHDCFTITEYMAMDHFGITEPGEAWKALEDRITHVDGSLPVNPSGGLIGAGHPVGATGARMVLDAHRQVTGAAGDYQVEGARRVQTLNIGGSATTIASFVLER
ncbi:MAG: acetyl-CoA acetyltransferase [Acidimicrobiia bacterium]|nr:acetyl-CoA acetyltransferase [Acidimicrobiia bacterium]